MSLLMEFLNLFCKNLVDDFLTAFPTDISTMSAEGGRGPGGNNTSLESATAVTSEEG